MNVLILLPGLISLYFVSRRKVATAFLSVYLPCLLLLPQQYSLRIPHLPPFSAAEFALIPLGFVAIGRFPGFRSLALMDILIVFFVSALGLSEILHEPVRNTGILIAVNSFVSMVMTYAVGRCLIEPRLRLATVRRFVLLVLLNFVPGVWQWRMQQNLYAVVGERLFGAVFQHGTWVQVRNGRGRLDAAFGDAEVAGIVFAMAFCLNGWLVYLRRIGASLRLRSRWAQLEKYHLPELMLLACLWMTESRGPEIALIAGFIILQIPRVKRVRFASLVVAGLLLCGYLEVSSYFNSYAKAPTYMVLKDEKSSVAYRLKMDRIYAPIAEAGGWTGWSVLGVPHVDGLKSIDDQYLLVHLAYGRLGYILFLLIVWENTRVVVTRAWQFKDAQDRAFAFSMLATMMVLWLSILTVFLGAPLPQIAFLLIGWSQSMRPERISDYRRSKITEGRLSSPRSIPLAAGPFDSLEMHRGPSGRV